ncbi:DUF1801 domain-containing protein [Ochrobactrum quorumnocens]|uniref:DUF1801 domain-containing protein n=1 Tax=Ochrobactrum quorumnocens TaxID=271865 RepID=A0A5N1K111_9HYPH|nr:DUF1801 domain-containing protein [[Ochrobactrum] quorumnocens]KAA9368241.1 DUF1801 domain-containing protein [[Ochrobactrum] quorumnocens]MBD7991861.1 DUF1801 domain-containing protein [Ochrobactrum gallinarum]
MSSIKVDALLEGVREFHNEQFDTVQRLREMVLASGDPVREHVKFGGILFSARADFCGIFSFKDHLNLEFSHGATFLDPYGLLRGAGSLRRHIRLQQFSDIESKHVSYYIRIARQIADH